MFHVEHCIGKNVRTRPFPKWEGVDSIGVAGASRQGRVKLTRLPFDFAQGKFSTPGSRPNTIPVPFRDG